MTIGRLGEGVGIARDGIQFGCMMGRGRRLDARLRKTARRKEEGVGLVWQRERMDTWKVNLENTRRWRQT